MRAGYFADPPAKNPKLSQGFFILGSMRILHTSDWHLGRNFGDFSLLSDQAQFVEWLVGQVREQSIDLVLVAGDLYDRAVPPVGAVTLFSQAVREIRAAGAQIIAIAGNHDSAERIGAHDGLVGAGIIIRGGYDHAADVTLRTIAGTDVAIVATPFLDPLMAPVGLRNELQANHDASADAPRRLSHERVLRHALQDARAQIPVGTPSIVLSHAFVTGAAPSDSERELAVGDSGMVSADVFADFDYVALGHLHRPQSVGEHDHIRYCGSPLPYSFSETHDKVVTIVDLDSTGVVAVTEQRVEVGRRVKTVRGTFEDLQLAEPTNDWVRVELTNPTIVVDAHRRLRDLFPNLVEIARVAPRLHAPTETLTPDQVRARPAAELATEFWNEITGVEATESEQAILAAAVAGAERELGTESAGTPSSDEQAA